jgi:hypothetical protein
MLKGHVKHEITALNTGLSIVPTRVPQHPRTDKKNGQKQKQRHPPIRCFFVTPIPSSKQKSINQALEKKDQEPTAAKIKMKGHGSISATSL